MQGVPAGPWRVVVGTPREGWTCLPDCELAPGSPGVQTVSLERTAPLLTQRHVTLAQRSAEVLGGRRFLLLGDGWIRGGVTSPQGHLVLAAPPGRATLLLAEPATPRSWRVLWNLGAADRVEVPPADGTGRIVGRVLGPDGEPLGGVAVRAKCAGSSWLADASPPACSQADGTFVLDKVESGPVWLLALGAG
ncbi:MAG: hypothetical protein R3F05_15085 [Planctomycetota bacterium]